MIANVINIKPMGNAADVISSLRRLADDIEAKREDCPMTLICVADDGLDHSVRMWVWGNEVPKPHLSGVLFSAAMMPVMPE